MAVTKRDRRYQVILIASFIPLCWLGMMIVHEAGHCVAALLTGGQIERVVLNPLTFSRTDVIDNPHPLIVAWAGAVVGVVLPVPLLGIAKVLRLSVVYLLRFFAGVCLLTNGLYLGVGVFWRVGDAGDLLNYGAEKGHLVLFGLLTVPFAFVLWNGIGPEFGFGRVGGRVSRRHAVGSLVLLIIIVIGELIYSGMSG